jgi:hypothetical protein
MIRLPACAHKLARLSPVAASVVVERRRVVGIGTPLPRPRREMKAILGTWFLATTDSAGPDGALVGMVTDPSWFGRDLLKVKHLVSGFTAKEVGAEEGSGTYGLVFEPRPDAVLVVFDDNDLAERLWSEAQPKTAVLRYISEHAFGHPEKLVNAHNSNSDSVPHARLGWLRGEHRWGLQAANGQYAVELRTAILSLHDHDVRKTVESMATQNKLPGVTLRFDAIFNNDAFTNTDGFVLINIVATGTKGSNMGTQAQKCFHVREMRHSPQFCLPFMFYQGDDHWALYDAHARTPMPNAPTKLPTMHKALQDMCDSPFELEDGRLITFCGPSISDYKCTCGFCGLDISPRSDQNDVWSQTTNAQRASPPSPLAFAGHYTADFA